MAKRGDKLGVLRRYESKLRDSTIPLREIATVDLATQLRAAIARAEGRE